MKKMLLIFVVSFSLVLPFAFIQNVKAYAENSFLNETCITDTTWNENAMTEYKLNNETGTYEVSGETYETYITSEKTDKHIFYLPSNDGKLLYAFIPNYSTVTSTDEGKNEIVNVGINASVTCADTLMVNKTVVGNPADSDSYMNFGGTNNSEYDESSSEMEQGNSEPTTEAENAQTNPNEIGNENTVTKIQSPNTASPMKITAIVLSALLVSIAVYSFIKKSHPDFLKKFNVRK